mgnify:CR=1 FL=1
MIQLEIGCFSKVTSLEILVKYWVKSSYTRPTLLGLKNSHLTNTHTCMYTNVYSLYSYKPALRGGGAADANVTNTAKIQTAMNFMLSRTRFQLDSYQ